MMAKTGGHFAPCNVGSVEAHNERRPDYLESVKASGRNLYFFGELTYKNSSWVNPVYSEETIDEIFADLKQLYQRKIGQAPQLEERTRINKKTGREYKVAGWSPIREAVIPIKEDTTINDFRPIINWLQSKGWNPIRIDLHKDEGNKDQITGNIKMNYHAHIVVDCVDHLTGRTVKLTERDMSLDGFQGICADALGMERGIPKTVTGAEHRNQWQQREWAAAQNCKKLETKFKGLTTMLENLETRKVDLLNEIYELEEESQSGQISVNELQRKLNMLHSQLEETEKKIEDRKEKLRAFWEELEYKADKLAEYEHKNDELIRSINREKEALNKLTVSRNVQEAQAQGWREFVNESREKLSNIESYRDNLSYDERKAFDKIYDEMISGSIMEDAAQQGNEIIAITAALYMGSVEQAMNFAQSRGGGGGGPSSGWGRKPGEDDDTFRGRCFGMAKLMMRKPSRQQQQSRGFRR